MNEKTIPTYTDSYDTLHFVHTKCVSVYKKVGYTPLQVVEDIRPYLLPDEAGRCTYVGRLDPMAEGWMYVLWNGDAEEKEKLLKFQKTYEVDIVFGVSTDTGDILGLVVDEKNTKITEKDVADNLKDFIGSFTYAYPKYSSPHMKKTLQNVEQESRKQKGYIYNIEFVSGVEMIACLLEDKITQKLSLVHMSGDFRIDDIQKSWKIFFEKHKDEIFFQGTIRVTCGSGTYMRTLAEELGNTLGVSACALSIRRIGIHA